jgi:glycosyltransferase involved in cell wall biosynthesis
MHVMVYNASWSTFGGGEKYLCAFAEAAAGAGHAVTMLVEDAAITRERLAAYFRRELRGVTVRPLRRRDVRRTLRGADAAVIVSNFVPWGIPVRRTVYVLQIPYPPITPATLAGRMVRGEVREAGKDACRVLLLRDARRAAAAVVYSDFVRDHLARSFGVRATTLYPPIDDFALPDIQRTKTILSVGRIFRGPYNDKRYDVLIPAFRELWQRGRAPEWEYWIAGSCGDDRASQAYLADLRLLAGEAPVRFLVNAPYGDLARMYNQATLFWHAAGYNVDELREPHRTEHFGMSTVEAMSASCVPVVIAKGGQREIVEHGKTGLLWSTPSELLAGTEDLLADSARLAALRTAARARSCDFRPERFVGAVEHLLTQLEHSS